MGAGAGNDKLARYPEENFHELPELKVREKTQSGNRS